MAKRIINQKNIEVSIKYSVIILSLNEANFIKRNLDSLKKFGKDIEIIVSDGGSSDGTLEICKQENVLLITSGNGRGDQLNKGAKAANGEILFFLHGDTFLPDDAFEQLDIFFENNRNNLCHFLLGFDVEHRMLDFYTSFSKHDSLFTRFGDSGIAIRKSLFEELGGFPNRATFEDVQFLQHARKKEAITVLPSKVNSSARRFIQNGLIRQQFINLFLFIEYFFKVKPETLTHLYNRKTHHKTGASLMVFLRFPQLGKVKTRLAAATTNEFALHFYKQCAEKVIHEIKKIHHINTYIFYSEQEESTKVKKWLGGKFFYSHQEGDNLGLRMKNAFQKVLTHGAGKVIIVGTDIPDLNKEIIEQAVLQLNENDIVIGPSKDGGYYLLGMKKLHAPLFEDIEFSTHSVLAETISKIKKLGLRYSMLPNLQDIDTEDELLVWLKNSKQSLLRKDIELVYNLVNGRIQQRCAHCGE